MPRKIDLTGKRYGVLTVTEQAETVNGRIKWLCECECGNIVTVKGIYLTTGETKSCGCLKTKQEQENLRKQYDRKRVNDVAMPLFKGKEPRKDSSTGYRGVSKYYTQSAGNLRYRAWITVKGKRYYKTGFLTAEDAYNNGRLPLEEKYLPKK